MCIIIYYTRIIYNIYARVYVYYKHSVLGNVRELKTETRSRFFVYHCAVAFTPAEGFLFFFFIATN